MAKVETVSFATIDTPLPDVIGSSARNHWTVGVGVPEMFATMEKLEPTFGLYFSFNFASFSITGLPET